MNKKRLEEIQAREDAATEGPWATCADTGCTKCMVVMGADYPVANVVSGEWGDSQRDGSLEVDIHRKA